MARCEDGTDPARRARDIVLKLVRPQDPKIKFGPTELWLKLFDLGFYFIDKDTGRKSTRLKETEGWGYYFSLLVLNDALEKGLIEGDLVEQVYWAKEKPKDDQPGKV